MALRLTYNRVRQLKRREAEARALLSPGAAPLPERPRPSPASPLTQGSLFSRRRTGLSGQSPTGAPMMADTIAAVTARAATPELR